MKKNINKPIIGFIRSSKFEEIVDIKMATIKTILIQMVNNRNTRFE